MEKMPVPAKNDASDSDAEAETIKRWLLMKTSLCGPRMSLAPGDKHTFDDMPGADGSPSEAQRLVYAGFAVDCDAPEA